MLVTSARIADVPVYLDGVGTAKALNAVTVRSQVDGKDHQRLVHGRPGRAEGLRARQDRSHDLPGAVRPGGGEEGTGRGAARQCNARLDLDRYTRLAATNAVRLVL
jgi:membrane fusion protein, multidrug efflux system